MTYPYCVMELLDLHTCLDKYVLLMILMSLGQRMLASYLA